MKNINDLQKKIQQNNETITANVTDPITKKIIKYNVVNKATLWRVQTLFSKEPITIKWIRKFQQNKVFFDVGANVGMYSIFAAINSLVKVYSFEPESNNFQSLMQNIHSNNLYNKVSAFPVGVSDTTKFTKLYLNSFSTADSHHSVNYKLDSDLKDKDFKYFQGIFSTSLDDLVTKWKLQIPNYIKIDVDGIENKIIDKSENILSNKKLNSMIIEFKSGRSEDLKTISKLESFGFKYDKKQVKNSERKNGYAEYLFFR